MTRTEWIKRYEMKDENGTNELLVIPKMEMQNNSYPEQMVLLRNVRGCMLTVEEFFRYFLTSPYLKDLLEEARKFQLPATVNARYRSSGAREYTIVPLPDFMKKYNGYWGVDHFHVSMADKLNEGLFVSLRSLPLVLEIIREEYNVSLNPLENVTVRPTEVRVFIDCDPLTEEINSEVVLNYEDEI